MYRSPELCLATVLSIADLHCDDLGGATSAPWSSIIKYIWCESLSGALYNIDHPILEPGFDAWIALLIRHEIVE